MTTQMQGMGQKRKVVDATHELMIKITTEDRALAVCLDPSNCVVARAVRRMIPDFFEAIQVGSSVTKIYTDTKVFRYATPSQLRRQIPVFDKTGTWDLLGEYTFRPLSPSMKLGGRENRWNRKSKTKSQPGRDMHAGHALPIRKVARVTKLETL